MCQSAAACRHTVLLLHVLPSLPLTHKALLPPPSPITLFLLPHLFCFCSVSCRRLRECRVSVSVVLFSVLIRSKCSGMCFLFYFIFLAAAAAGLNCKIWVMHAVSVRGGDFSVSLGLCGGRVCVCDFLSSFFSLFF